MSFSGLFFYILLFLLDFFHIAPEGRAADAQLTGSGGAVAAVGGAALVAEYNSLSPWEPETAWEEMQRGGCPLHPGAEKYYKEAGYMK